jgi:hypothetical protein
MNWLCLIFGHRMKARTSGRLTFFACERCTHIEARRTA